MQPVIDMDELFTSFNVALASTEEHHPDNPAPGIYREIVREERARLNLYGKLPLSEFSEEQHLGLTKLLQEMTAIGCQLRDLDND